MKLLILAYDFPPLISIGGLRPASWYKYFAALGVDVTVVTWDWEYELAKEINSTAHSKQQVITEYNKNQTLIKVKFAVSNKEKIAKVLHANKYRRVRQGITYIFSFLEYLNLKADPQAPLYHAADNLMQSVRFDFIIATGKPFILFRHAALLSKKHLTPWVADYRDSWTLNHIQSDYSLGFLSRMLNSFYKVIERKYVSTATIVTTVAPSYLAFLPDYIKADKYKIIYNGYDNEVEEQVKDLPVPREKFIISYAGIIYPMQNLEGFLDAIAIFVTQNNVSEDQFEMNFWGVDASATERLFNYNAKLKKYIRVHPKVEYAEVMRRLSYSHLLLILTTAADGWLNAKVFDYLALRRPVLMMGTKTNIMSGIISETNAGFVAENASSAATYIASLFKTSHEALPNNTVNYQQFSRRNQAEKFYLTLKSLI